MAESKLKLHVAKLLLLIPLVLYLAFIIPENAGLWDQLLGLNSAREVADRFEKSVGPDDAVPVKVGDKAFGPLITLIRKYSSAKLDQGKTPRVIARLQASVYDAQRLGPDGKLSQWSSPATPIVVFYYDWPSVRFPGDIVPNDLYTVVGTLGDLHSWIDRRHEDLHFEVIDLVLVGIVPLAVGLYEYAVEIRQGKYTKRKKRGASPL